MVNVTILSKPESSRECRFFVSGRMKALHVLSLITVEGLERFYGTTWQALKKVAKLESPRLDL